LLAMLVSYLVNDTWSLPSRSRSTGYGLVVTHPAVVLYRQRSSVLTYYAGGLPQSIVYRNNHVETYSPAWDSSA